MVVEPRRIKWLASVYNKIMQRVNVSQWVEPKGVKEVWIWGYHGGVIVAGWRTAQPRSAKYAQKSTGVAGSPCRP